MSREPNDFYDAPELYDRFASGVPGDEAWFAAHAKRAGKVLELASGTGRVTIPMARGGAKVTGLELSQTMLEAAAAKLALEPAPVRKRVKLLQGDMRGFALGQTFPLIVIPYRAFQHLMDTDDQKSCLHSCREHLTRQGKLVINLFDPNLRILGGNVDRDGTLVRKVHETPTSDGGQISVFNSRITCPEEQRFEEEWIFEKFNARGNSEWRKAHHISLRYCFRYEMEHLFELCGLQVTKLEGGFKGEPYRHGAEQIWTLCRA